MNHRWGPGLASVRFGPGFARPLWYKDDCLILWVQWCFACTAKQVELLCYLGWCFSFKGNKKQNRFSEALASLTFWHPKTFTRYACGFLFLNQLRRNSFKNLGSSNERNITYTSIFFRSWSQLSYLPSLWKQFSLSFLRIFK